MNTTHLRSKNIYALATCDKRSLLNEFVRRDLVHGFQYLCSKWNYKPALKAFFMNAMSSGNHQVVRYMQEKDNTLMDHYIRKTLGTRYGFLSHSEALGLIECQKMGAQIKDVGDLSIARIDLYMTIMRTLKVFPKDHLPFLLAHMYRPMMGLQIITPTKESLKALAYIAILHTCCTKEYKEFEQQLKSKFNKLSRRRNEIFWDLPMLLDLCCCSPRDDGFDRSRVNSIFNKLDIASISQEQWIHFIEYTISTKSQAAYYVLEHNLPRIMNDSGLFARSYLLKDLLYMAIDYKAETPFYLLLGANLMTGSKISIKDCILRLVSTKMELVNSAKNLDHLSARACPANPFDNSLQFSWSRILHGICRIMHASQDIWFPVIN
jgi:hypothetical protein